MAEEQRIDSPWLQVGAIFGAWTVFGVFMATQFVMQGTTRGLDTPWGPAISHALFEAWLWALVTLVIFGLTRRFPLERGHVLRRIPIHIIAAAALAFGRVVAMVEMSKRVEWLGERTFHRQYYSWFHNYVLFCLLLIGIAHAVVYYARYRERERMAERLAAGLTEARLHALKMQLQPHFLFNTLNAISALIPADAKPARRMVARLGDLLRTSLEHEDTQEVTLREELAFLDPYLEIEQARLGERLTVVMSVDPDTLDARVPHLMLQPLVENAVRHGVAARIGPGSVHISAATAADGSLQLEVRDSGPGLTTASQERTRKGVGLANVQLRLEQLYGQQHRFRLENHPEGGAVVRISLPLRHGQPAVTNGGGAS